MSESTPFNVLLTDFLPAALVESVDKEAVKVESVPPVRLLDDLRSPAPENDPSELIMHRFLYRGGVCLVLGPTGIGKSSFLMQLGIHFAVGKPLFGITPGGAYRERGMRVLLIQAENDEGDLAEMRDGVLAGCKDLTEADKAQAQKRFMVCTVNDRSGDKFALTLDALLTEFGPFDLVIVDPAFAYLGGDSNSQKDVSHFMRELLNPLLQRHRVGLILAHHTNKPLRGKEKDNWEAGDYAYLGAGSAEWINPARAAIALRSIGSDTIFELRAPKRGKRLRWQSDGVPTVTRFIAHHREVGVICWREAEKSEVEELIGDGKGGRPRKVDPIEVLHCIAANEGQSQAAYKAKASVVLKCSPTAIQEAIEDAVEQKLVRFLESGKRKLYSLTGKGRSAIAERQSTRAWGENPPETLSVHSSE